MRYLSVVFLVVLVMAGPVIDAQVCNIDVGCITDCTETVVAFHQAFTDGSEGWWFERVSRCHPPQIITDDPNYYYGAYCPNGSGSSQCQAYWYIVALVAGSYSVPSAPCEWQATTIWAASQVLYSDWSEVYWSAAAYRECNGNLTYVWRPVARYCPNEAGSCIARNLYPDLPPVH